MIQIALNKNSTVRNPALIALSLPIVEVIVVVVPTVAQTTVDSSEAKVCRRFNQLTVTMAAC